MNGGYRQNSEAFLLCMAASSSPGRKGSKGYCAISGEEVTQLSGLPRPVYLVDLSAEDTLEICLPAVQSSCT